MTDRTICAGLLVGLVAGAIGCESAPLNNLQRFEIDLDGIQTNAVVLTETLAVRDQVDSARDAEVRLHNSDAALVKDHRFCINVPANNMSGTPLFWYSEFSEFRLTVFAPGCAIMTVYPEGATNVDPKLGPVRGQALLGWRTNKWRPMSSRNSLQISNSYNATASEVRLKLTLRRVHAEGHTVMPSPSMGEAPPSELCDVDALNLTDRIDALVDASDARFVNDLPIQVRHCIWDTVEAEYSGLVRSGFNALLPPADGMKMRKLRSLLKR